MTVTFRAAVGPVAATGPSRDQAGTKLGLSRDQAQVLEIANVPRSIQELMAPSGRTNRTKFRDQVLRPLFDAGLLELTIPDKPRSPPPLAQGHAAHRSAVGTRSTPGRLRSSPPKTRTNSILTRRPVFARGSAAASTIRHAHGRLSHKGKALPQSGLGPTGPV